MIDGLIAIWKEQDFTSHDVIAKMRGILRQKKIGHTGTLDPKAEGVLLVGLGIGTRACNLLPDKTKIYEAEITLGIAADTEDIWGNIETEKAVSVTKEAFEEAICSFQGTYMQTPPMYSAKKINGQKLYDLARQGKVVERQAVPVTIHQISVHSVCGNKAVFSVECSQGTYIRTLCVDIGKKLGVPACMSRLTRTSAGGFDRTQALTLSELEKVRDENRVQEYVIPVEEALSMYPALYVSQENSKPLLNGNSFSPKALKTPLSRKEGMYRVWLEDGTFIGIYEWVSDKRLFVPHKIFYRTGGDQ